MLVQVIEQKDQKNSIYHIKFSLLLVPLKPAYKWLQNDAWLNLVELSKLYQFNDILNSVSR